MLLFGIRYIFVMILDFTFFHKDHEHLKLNFKTFLSNILNTLCPKGSFWLAVNLFQNQLSKILFLFSL